MKKKEVVTESNSIGSILVEPVKAEAEPIDADLDTRQIVFLTHYYNPYSEGFLKKNKAALMANFSEAEARNLDTTLDSILGRKMKEMEAAFHLKGINPLRLAEMHMKLLSQTEKRINFKTGKIEDTGNIDVGAVRASLDMIHKIRGDYAPEKIALGVGIASIKEILDEVQAENE